ncbi:hypothetical protein [Endozoicomonas acroporae]|uniref:hypothetical protein n=1 Tax=Endozoicomonas acroporae TaxID=1701104 RepID=UPI003D79020D
MTKIKRNIEAIKNQHIENAKKVTEGLKGMEKAEAVKEYFVNNSEHPHAEYTFKEMLLNRNPQNDHSFAYKVMNQMADLAAHNESPELAKLMDEKEKEVEKAEAKYYSELTM